MLCLSYIFFLNKYLYLSILQENLLDMFGISILMKNHINVQYVIMPV